VSARELAPAITVLQLFLSSSKPVLRFAALRTLNRVAMTHPMAVTNCNIDMEGLIGDSNRSIATLGVWRRAPRAMGRRRCRGQGQRNWKGRLRVLLPTVFGPLEGAVPPT
jgi:hypothetical protein